MKKISLLLTLILCFSFLSAVQRDKVLVEIGTGAWCQYCPGAAMGADDLVENGQPVAIIENHNGDPYATTDSNGRNTYYGITGYPTAWFDGLNPQVGGSHTASMYSYYLPKVQARMQVASHFTISATGNHTDNNYNVNVVLNKVETDTNTNLRFHAVITESHIQYSWQGQSELNFVNRLMITGLNGQAIDFNTNSTLNIPLTFTANPAWVIGNCELVLFIQNNTSKEVLQATKYSFIELFGGYAPSLTQINFPDIYVSGQTTLPLTINNYWNITATGTISSDNPAFLINPAERLNFSIPPYGSTAFNVIFAPTAAGDFSSNLIITSNMPGNENLTIPLTGHAYLDTAPYVTDVQVSGIPVFTMLQTAAYTFHDEDNDAEGTSAYQWFRLTPPATQGIAISGANNVTYRLVQADIGSQLAVQVTPHDEHNMPGTPVMSAYGEIIENLPAPQNLTAQITNDNQDVILNWEAPNHFARDFIGYKLFRNDLPIGNFQPNITTFIDTGLYPSVYQYWVIALFSNPLSQSDPSNVVTVNLTSADDNVLPVTEIVNIYPNPFRTEAVIKIVSKAKTPVEASIYNLRGRLMQRMKAETDAEGTASINLQKTSDMLPGVYFVKISTPTSEYSRKVIVLK